MILTLSNSSEGSLGTMSEVPPEIMEGHPEELPIEILLKPEVSGGDFFASNIWFASLRISGLSTSHEHTSNEFLQSSKSFGIFLGSGGGGGSGGASSTLSLSKIYNFN
jgi:hypothetical protein